MEPNDPTRPATLEYATPLPARRYGIEHVIAALCGITLIFFGVIAAVTAIIFVVGFFTLYGTKADDALGLLGSATFSLILLSSGFKAARFGFRGKTLR